MKIIFLILSVLLFDIMTAQEHPPTDTTSSFVADSTDFGPDSTKTQKQKSYDTIKHGPSLNMYGDLLNDDREYNKRYALWKPATRVVLADAFNWALARYVFNYD